jgi:hypothetical protein
MGCSRNLRDMEPIQKWGILLEEIPLSDTQKEAIRIRIISVLEKLRYRLLYLTYSYNILRTTTTVGSLLVPSLLAVQSNVDQGGAYWAMWGIGLVVSFSNAFVSLFRVDKNYFTIGEMIEKIESEAWMYLTLSGKYKIEDPGDVTERQQYQTMFHTFMERCESLLHKAVLTEFSSTSASSTNKSVMSDFHTPFQAKQLQPELVKLYEPEVVRPSVDDDAKSDRPTARIGNPSHFTLPGNLPTIEERTLPEPTSSASPDENV